MASALLTGAVVSCGGSPTPPEHTGTRGYRMGFSSLPPRLTLEDVRRTVKLWTPRADAAILHIDVPWAALLDGGDAGQIATAEHLDLVQLYRGRDLMGVVAVDATNALAREREAEALGERGRSITEPAVQALYRAWVLAVAEVLRPDLLGLTAETNLVRAIAGFTDPHALPGDYYGRIGGEAALPVLVVEGGWPSASTSAFVSSPALQADYFRRQTQLLQAAGAVAVFQLTFTDLDLDAWPQPVPEILPLFATLGLVDAEYAPKPALPVWDSLHATPLQP